MVNPPVSSLPHHQVVQEYNSNPNVHGILVQLPLPKHINEKVILDAVSIEKDVDGFHPTNIGCLGMRGREPLFVPCTPMVSGDAECTAGSSGHLQYLITQDY
jgi:5,10-methylene-tetrahydrofolate dehydrogenase/methenyl tetrahydrofolate cyclohydrolase